MLWLYKALMEFDLELYSLIRIVLTLHSEYVIVKVLAHYALDPLSALYCLLLALLVYHLILALKLTHQLLDPLTLSLPCLPRLYHVPLLLIEPFQYLSHRRTLLIFDLRIEGPVALRGLRDV